jgi:hypothetical protein
MTRAISYDANGDHHVWRISKRHPHQQEASALDNEATGVEFLWCGTYVALQMRDTYASAMAAKLELESQRNEYGTECSNRLLTAWK